MTAPEARLDPLAGHWVILAPGRAGRPGHGAGPTAPGHAAAPPPDCAFCPGNEHETPPEIARAGPGPPGGPGWRVRVFPNRYPLVSPVAPNAPAAPAPADPTAPAAPGDPAPADRAAASPTAAAPAEPTAAADPAGPVAPADGVRRRVRVPAGGAHEVVVLSPDHRRSLGRLDGEHVIEVLAVLRDRARAHAAAGRAVTQAFVNHGAEGGASLAHPHAQLVATDLGSRRAAAEAARMVGGGGCLLCAELAGHRRDAAPVVAAAAGAELWCPWWSGSAFEMLLAPAVHRARFERAGPELPAVAETLAGGLARLDRALGDPPYNLAVHSLPAALDADFHWHVHVWPRLQRDAGLELATGLRVNLVDPLDAAERLRRA